MDDHKYSVNRIVAYSHRDPEHEGSAYGPGGPGRTYGYIADVRLVEGTPAYWEYTVVNSFTEERRVVAEADVFHGANRGFLDMRRRDGIAWAQGPPEPARSDAGSGFWHHTLREFTRKEIPKILEREQHDRRVREEGVDLELGVGDYVKIRGDLRPEMEASHSLYAKVLEVIPAEDAFADLPDGRRRVLYRYRVLLDDGSEACVLDAEVRTAYTRRSRSVVLNWRAACFLAEAFGDDPPYETGVDYLSGHVFARSELEAMDKAELGEILSRLLYVKGLATLDESSAGSENLRRSPREYLIDHVLEVSRFDMRRNRTMTVGEIEELRSHEQRLRSLLE